MAQTKIEWTATYDPFGTSYPGYTFNPWIGCVRVSPGCQHCYAETLMDKRYGRVTWGPGEKRERTSDAYWKKPYTWDRNAATTGIRRKVFCASLADVFEPNAQLTKWRQDLWSLIHETPNLDWLLLTKRPENVLELVPYEWGHTPDGDVDIWPTNVWIGTSAENQEWADRRVAKLVEIPAYIRFLSLEPLIGPIDLTTTIWCGEDGTRFCDYGFRPAIDWVIVGGESGKDCRPMELDWARDIRDQCQKAGIAFFFKQVGGYPDKRDTIDKIPADLRIRQFPK